MEAPQETFIYLPIHPSPNMVPLDGIGRPLLVWQAHLTGALLPFWKNGRGGRKETCAEGASERGFPTRTRIALAGPIQDDDTLSQASLFKQEGRKWVFVK